MRTRRRSGFRGLKRGFYLSAERKAEKAAEKKKKMEAKAAQGEPSPGTKRKTTEAEVGMAVQGDKEPEGTPPPTTDAVPPYMEQIMKDALSMDVTMVKRLQRKQRGEHVPEIEFESLRATMEIYERVYGMLFKTKVNGFRLY